MGPTGAAALTTHELDPLFERLYPAAVGLSQLILDRDRTSVAISRPVAEQIAMDVFVHSNRHHSIDDARGVASVLRRVADACLDRLVGHPGSVELRTDLLGPDVDFDGTLSLSELQQALCDMRRRDRRVGLLTLAAGLTPSEVAALLQLPLDDVLRSSARVAIRLADGRRLSSGLVPEFHSS